ncbi:UbiA family prenyltransferase [Solitalea lacus]|uniref:UbiA family prenyltransferase n=1 Tax=Solitalea lacus TaxID=2911172 RepID=UPI001EDAB506|nr:UbiA family prenyltransferase [Solitalea lacus]UKJ07306.1 UbiA family prenyltransferase [Solitalea lacus]
MSLKNTIKLLRFPFSFFLMPVFLLALSQAKLINWKGTILSFLILHLFIYPASNGYNSFMDKDEGSIGGLKHPPKPTQQLFYGSLILDSTGLLLSFLISPVFSVCVLLYILASRAYSYKGIRLKKYPYLGFLTVVIFQGGFSYLMAYIAVTHIEISHIITTELVALIACSTLIAGVYPLTQVYQHEEDIKHGDITISYKLGFRGTFIFSAIQFIITNILFFIYFNSAQKLNNFIILQLFFIPVAIYFVSWIVKVWNNPCKADFEHTMKMNLTASVCMNGCFIILSILNHFL